MKGAMIWSPSIRLHTQQMGGANILLTVNLPSGIVCLPYLQIFICIYHLCSLELNKSHSPDQENYIQLPYIKTKHCCTLLPSSIKPCPISTLFAPVPQSTRAGAIAGG